MSPSLSGVFAPWLGERILENSGDLLVVDKPSGLSVHGAGLPDHDVFIDALTFTLGAVLTSSIGVFRASTGAVI